MRILYFLTAGTADPTKVSLPVHLAVNGSVEVGDEPTLVLAGDGTELVRTGVVDTIEGVGVPPLRELFAKLRQHEVPVFI